MNIVQLHSADQKILSAINRLLRQISNRVGECSPELLREIVKSSETEFWLVKEGEEVVGMGVLALVLRPEGISARIEDVVIREGERGKGHGTALLEKLIARAKGRGASLMQLTSNSKRVAAIKLYQKLGFKMHETNSYYLKL